MGRPVGIPQPKEAIERTRLYFAGKTYEELYGPEKARKLRELRRQEKIDHPTLNFRHTKSHTENAKKKMSESCRLSYVNGRIHPLLGTHNHPQIVKAVQSSILARLGKPLSPEHVRKVMRRRVPTSLEEKFLSIVKRNNLPYAYVGDGAFLVENRNPDFINVNGEKIAVEVYSRFYKNVGGREIEKWKKERTELFNKYGWTIYFFSEVELTEENVRKTLGELTLQT